ncbi:hypothetical protein DL96DRAFT_1721319 [Flagelloscypha sp. PMI_526]|nr:hypothetical protein DL96DRAFT_1721319 [Flagelloscypha sp. PMI_526]
MLKKQQFLKFNLVNQKVSCPGHSAGLTVDVNSNAQVIVTVGIAAAGTIIPHTSNFKDFALTTTINGDISSSIDLKASVSGSLGPRIQSFRYHHLGPAFKIDAQALATLDLNVDVNIGVSYKPFFPSCNGDKVGTFSIGDTSLKLSASPRNAARGEVQAHMIPALTLSIDAISSKAKADAFVNLNASAHAVLTLNANTEASASINTTGGKKRASPAHIEGRQVQTTASAGFGGCFDVLAQLDVNTSVEGSLFGIFDATKNFNLFTKQLDLFKKCFGNQAHALPGLLMEHTSYTALSSHKHMSKAGVADTKSVDSANAAASAQ